MSNVTPISTSPVAKPASESKTLRFNNLMMGVAAAVAALPSILGWVIDALGDPNIASMVNGMIPAKDRAVLALIMAGVAYRNKQLRYQTTQPIEKAPVT